jgi:hypothetical protein
MGHPGIFCLMCATHYKFGWPIRDGMIVTGGEPEKFVASREAPFKHPRTPPIEQKAAR